MKHLTFRIKDKAMTVEQVKTIMRLYDGGWAIDFTQATPEAQKASEQAIEEAQRDRLKTSGRRTTRVTPPFDH